MSYDDSSVFTFDLNEVLSFKNGQEVKEMIGISLEPEISVQEYREYVSIRGVMELKGEYFFEDQKLDLEAVANREDIDSIDYPTHRYMDEVKPQDEGVNQFSHHFPVEVSIPLNRVTNLDEIMVGIEAFDYELPDSSQLKIRASIAIHGVHDDEVKEREELEEIKQYEVEEELTETVSDVEDPWINSEDTFTFDLKEAADEKEAEDNRSPEPPIIKDVSKEVPEEKEVKEEKEEKEESIERWPNKKSQSFATFFDHEDSNEESIESIASVELIESVESIESIASEELLEANVEDDVEVNRIEVKTKDSKRVDDEQQEATYLLDIFNEEEEEQAYTKLRMCIVQGTDTLQTLADRYDLSPLQLSQTNNLANDDLKSGQILYIPEKRKKEKK
ncbi:stage VI sporulation protein D [Paraliobacillus sediminis]|uniref:stage VI sporulation protein D n=1 Tax=Paraliobacillus sediminis TaxID=1885916 RepID=UPI000E3CAEBD|nr:stage VI sporulation protein D [Paraliobacillus sediminis]